MSRLRWPDSTNSVSEKLGTIQSDRYWLPWSIRSAKPRAIRLDRAVASPEPLRERLEGRKAAPHLAHMPAHALGVPMVHRREGPDPAVLRGEHPYAVGAPHDAGRRGDNRPVVRFRVTLPPAGGVRAAPARASHATPASGRPGSAQIGPAAAGQARVAHESPAAAGENRRPAGEACPVLLAPARRRASDPAAVRRHTAEDRGTASAGRLTRGTCGASGDERTHVGSGVCGMP